ncbi:MAG: trypsin-like peptidase domain-containing protein [Pirellulales bacterium]|nr:trypsin-like peptidase domain-containing protein [Pirellulales bacterium]
MLRPFFVWMGALAWLSLLAPLFAAEPDQAPSTSDAATVPTDVAELAARVRDSIVVITTTGRDGRPLGVGSGFILSAEGLIATNYHVIGDARPIRVELADGRKLEAVAVQAFDRKADLAIIRVDATGLQPLELGDSDAVRAGQPVMALGNPIGLERSVVAGVASATREIDGRPMIQLAMPIESGNSGGPVVDLEGRVLGIVTIKSIVTANLGFAVAVKQLRPLIEKPNPIPMARWLTIGQLRADQWQPVFGARWRQRAGRLVVDGLGEGFGGRSLCLAVRDVPEAPYELTVSVKLADESGAAGLAFDADGGDIHYGFYPTAGRLRLTRFNGPDVNSWTILAEEESDHYRPGDWNLLKVRRESDRLLCYVNDQLVIESREAALPPGKAGLAKFRDTAAEFKGFALERELPRLAPTEDVLTRLLPLIEEAASQEAGEDLITRLLPDANAGAMLLRRRARELAESARHLEELADAVRRAEALQVLERATNHADAEIDLVKTALLIARLDNDEIDVAAYEQAVADMAAEIKSSLVAESDESARLAALDRYLFEENGFHGSRTEYDNRANSYLNEVLDDREGLPLTLAVLYMELGRRLDLKIEGVPLPGHFIVRYVPSSGEPQLIDVFERGVRISREEAEDRVELATGAAAREAYFEAASHRAILVRLLRNLLGLSQQAGELDRARGYLDAILIVDEHELEARSVRAVLRFQSGDRAGAIADIDWLLEHGDAELDLDRVRQFRDYLENQP